MALLIFGLVPLACAAAIIRTAIYCLLRRPGLIQAVLAVPTVLLALWALLVLLAMMSGAWPTERPFYALAAAVPLAFVQWLHARRARN
jgi:hypothetical protein